MAVDEAGGISRNKNQLGTREHPLELSDSDGDVPGPTTFKLPQGSSDPRVKAKTSPARRKTYLGIIELTDSEGEEEENIKPLASKHSPQRISTRGKRGLAAQGRRASTSSHTGRKQRKVSNPSDVKNESVDWIGDGKKFHLDNFAVQAGLKVEAQVLKSEDIKMALDDIELPPNCRSDATLLKAEPRLKEEPKVDVSEPALPLADTHPASERHAHSSSPAPKEEPLPATLGDSELRGAVAKLINPKAEVKKELRLDDDDVLRLLDPSALAPYPISLPMDLRSTTISRDKLSKRYGGSAMDTFPTPSAHKLAEHGRKNFMCINLSLWNPNGPQVPGHGGLFFTTAEEDDTWAREADGRPTVYTVFARLRSNEWLYLGQYELHSAPNLSAQQWCALSPYVRACWTKNICKKNWGARVRARIHLRTTLGHEPSRDEVDSARGNFAHVTPEQINSAFVAGEEYIETWSMKCVGYDEDFQKEIVELARG